MVSSESAPWEISIECHHLLKSFEDWATYVSLLRWRCIMKKNFFFFSFLFCVYHHLHCSSMIYIYMCDFSLHTYCSEVMIFCFIIILGCLVWRDGLRIPNCYLFSYLFNQTFLWCACQSFPSMICNSVWEMDYIGFAFCQITIFFTNNMYWSEYNK
jgi:hypothetical protein